MKKVNIYFNRWFSVAYHYMNLIRNNEDGVPVQIFATHPDIHHMSLQGADVAGTEPSTDWNRICSILRGFLSPQ